MFAIFVYFIFARELLFYRTWVLVVNVWYVWILYLVLFGTLSNVPYFLIIGEFLLIALPLIMLWTSTKRIEDTTFQFFSIRNKREFSFQEVSKNYFRTGINTELEDCIAVLEKDKVVIDFAHDAVLCNALKENLRKVKYVIWDV